MVAINSGDVLVAEGGFRVDYMFLVRLGYRNIDEEGMNTASCDTIDISIKFTFALATTHSIAAAP